MTSLWEIQEQQAPANRAAQTNAGDVLAVPLTAWEILSLCVNAGESHSVVASETDTIARAMSILYGVIREHPGRLTYEQACDVVLWAERNGLFRW